MSEKTRTQRKEQKKVLRITDVDPKFKYEIRKIPGVEKIRLCFQCGTCTADCPIARFTESYRPRKLMRMTHLGLKNRLLPSDVLWLCTTCFTCVDHCPQGVDVANVVRALRNLAVKEGYMPSVYKDLSSCIRDTGYAYGIPGLRIRKRGELGLPPIPKADKDSIKKLFDITGFPKEKEKGAG